MPYHVFKCFVRPLASAEDPDRVVVAYIDGEKSVPLWEFDVEDGRAALARLGRELRAGEGAEVEVGGVRFGRRALSRYVGAIAAAYNMIFNYTVEYEIRRDPVSRSVEIVYTCAHPAEPTVVLTQRYARRRDAVAYLLALRECCEAEPYVRLWGSVGDERRRVVLPRDSAARLSDALLAALT